MMAARLGSTNANRAVAPFAAALVVGTAMLFSAGPAAATPNEVWHYHVKPGDTLSSVAATYCKSPNDWKALQRINGVPNTRRLMPGTRLTIPVRLIRKADAFARAMMVRGQVQIMGPAGKPKGKVARGARLKVGDTVHTGAHSTLMLMFVDKSRMLVSQNSTIKLLNLINYGNTGIAQTGVRVSEGRTESQVSHQMGGAAKYEVSTPVINLAVRGTDFRVGVGAGGKSLAAVTKGFIAANGDGGGTMVHRGYGLEAQSGKPLGKPMRLLPPPTLAPLKPVYKNPPVQLNWKALPKAVAYRVQVYSPDVATGDLVLDRRMDKTALKLADLPDGEYAVRLRAIAASGLGGDNSSAMFKVGEGPLPPRAVAPMSGDQPGGDKVMFTWTRVAKAATYRFEVSDTDDFSHLVARVWSIPSARHGVLLPLKPGRYSWRVASVSKGGTRGGYSVPQTFDLHTAPSSRRGR